MLSQKKKTTKRKEETGDASDGEKRKEGIIEILLERHFNHIKIYIYRIRRCVCVLCASNGMG